VLALKISFEKGTYQTLEQCDNPHNICSLINMFFMELPDPLIPVSNYEDFIMVAEMDEESKRLQQYYTLLTKLPSAHTVVLRYFLSFCDEITKHIDNNKMSSTNLGVVFGPIFLRPKKLDPKKIMLQAKIIEHLISHYSTIFVTGGITLKKP